MRTIIIRAQRVLSLSIAAALAAPLVASAHDAVVVEDGAHFDLADDSIISNANGVPGILARTAATASLRQSDISVSGNFAHGAVVNSAGSWIEIDGGAVSTQGREGYGLYATAGAIRATNAQISTTGAGAIGLLARGPEAAIALTDSNVIVEQSGHAAAATGGAQLQLIRTSLTAGLTSGNGLTVRDADTHASVIDSQITARGNDAHGVVVTGPATVQITGSQVSAAGERSRGVWASGNNHVVIDGSRIETHGDRTLDGAGSMFGPGAVVASRGADISLNNSAVFTSGFSAGGLNAEGQGSRITMEGGSIVTTGDQSRGATAHGGNNRVDLVGVQVLSEGAGSQGVAAGDAGSVLNMTDSSVETRGADGAGIFARDSGVVSLTRSTVSTHGAGAAGADMRGGTQLLLQSSELRSGAAAALQLDQATVNATQGSRLEAGNGVLAEFRSDAANSIVLDTGSVGLGDIRFIHAATDADGNGALDRTSSLTLDNQSAWKGATDAIGDLSLAHGSRWDVTGDSTVGSLSLVDSTVAFDPADLTYKTLVVEGDFHADNGLLAMNSMLGDDSSPGDLLHVKGDTSGNARIAVNNIGGTGAPTNDGIKLVQVDGTSAGVYTLAGRAVGGAYEYFLYQGGVSTPNDGDWYLRSDLVTFDPPADPCADGGCAGDPPLTPMPILRPEAGAYLANQASALGLFNMELHERVGEPNLAQRQQGDGRLGGVWARVISEQPRYRVTDQLTGQGRSNVVQIGGDLTSWGRQDRGVVGVMAASGQTSHRIRSELTGYTAEGRLDGRSLGVYGTWIQDAKDDGGLYVDSWLQAARFKNRVQGENLAREHYRSRSLSASVEAGYALRLRQSDASALYLEPQVQAIWTDYRMDGRRHQEVNGTVVKVADAGSLQTRVGARLYGHSTSTTGNRVQPFVAVNWIRNGSDANAMWLGEQRVQGALSKNVYEAKVGAQLQLTSKLTGWGELNTQQGDYGFRSVGGQLGVKYAW